MKIVIDGQATAVTAAPTYTLEGQIAAFKASLNGLLATSDVITDAEYQTAASNIARCESLEILRKWYCNCVREIARREELEPETAPITYATAEQKQEVITLCNTVWILRKEKTQAHLRLPSLTEVQATVLIGELWAKILRRQERAAEGHADAASSFSEAA